MRRRQLDPTKVRALARGLNYSRHRYRQRSADVVAVADRLATRGFPAKHIGHCCLCGGTIAKGQTIIRWSQTEGRRYVHAMCAPKS